VAGGVHLSGRDPVDDGAALAGSVMAARVAEVAVKVTRACASVRMDIVKDLSPVT
jgi:hypothetical protein